MELYLNSITVLRRMREVTGKFYDYKTFCELADQSEIKGIFEDIIEKLSTALVSVVNILNPELMVIGHSGAWWSDIYVKKPEDEINKKKFSNRQNRLSVTCATYLEKIPVLGGSVI